MGKGKRGERFIAKVSVSYLNVGEIWVTPLGEEQGAVIYIFQDDTQR